MTRHPQSSARSRHELRTRLLRGVFALAAGIAAMAPLLAVPASAAGAQSSSKVALIPGNGPVPPAGLNGQDGVMPTSSFVSGRPSESFDKFSFHDVGLNQITDATLAKFDTVALIQVSTSGLSSAAKSALAGFVAGGGKLIIHDADETSLNDYSWLLPGSHSTQVGASCNGCGSTSGSSQITENSGLISANPSDPTYVDVSELAQFTDALGDANLLVSDDPRWFAAASGTNGNNEAGSQLAYASNNGLIIYNGFDTDMIKPSPSSPWRCVGTANFQCPADSHPSVDWLAQMWYAELNKAWGPSGSAGSNGGGSNGGGSNGLPQGTPVNSIGTVVPPSQAGLPTTVTKPTACIARSSIFLRLMTLARHHHHIVQVDLYVNGRHVLREHHLHNVVLTGLPRHRYVTLKIVATTKRRYHLISSVRYRAC